jgi:two-component system cell cycle response regulator
VTIVIACYDTEAYYTIEGEAVMSHQAVIAPTILLVDDDIVLRSALLLRLKKLDYKVLVADDGQAGLKAAFHHKPDIVILDLLMPHMNGYEMLSKLRADDWGKTVPVIILSNDDSDTAELRTTGDGAPAIYLKSNTSLKQIEDAIYYHLL